MSRRAFLGGLGGMGALALAGCSFGGSNRTGDLGGSDQLRMLTWTDYIDTTDSAEEGTVDRVRDDLGLDVAYAEDYADNYDGYQLILDQAVNRSQPAYDLVVPTNWRAAQMIQQGWAEPLPLELIPNHANLDPAYMTNGWDRGSRYQMPWQAGITGIAYDPKATRRPITSVNDLFDPALAGRVGFIGEMRESVGLAMLANGDDPSRPTEATARAGLDRVRRAVESGQVGAVTQEDFATRLESGQLAVAMAWSGDTSLLRARRPDIEFVVPAEGAIQWFDAMVIPRRAANIAAAGRFMNYVYDPANAARITAAVGFISPVLGVQEALSAAGGELATLADDPVLFPDASLRSRLFTWGGLDTATETSIDDEFRTLVP